MIEQLKEDFEEFRERCMGILLFGSYVEGEQTKRSDIDVCVDVVMDVVAMATRDLGLAVEDDYTNIKKLEKEKVLTTREGDLIRRSNGLRNAK